MVNMLRKLHFDLSNLQKISIRIIIKLLSQKVHKNITMIPNIIKFYKPWSDFSSRISITDRFFSLSLTTIPEVEGSGL